MTHETRTAAALRRQAEAGYRPERQEGYQAQRPFYRTGLECPAVPLSAPVVREGASDVSRQGSGVIHCSAGSQRGDMAGSLPYALPAWAERLALWGPETALAAAMMRLGFRPMRETRYAGISTPPASSPEPHWSPISLCHDFAYRADPSHGGSRPMMACALLALTTLVVGTLLGASFQATRHGHQPTSGAGAKPAFKRPPSQSTLGRRP